MGGKTPQTELQEVSPGRTRPTERLRVHWIYVMGVRWVVNPGSIPIREKGFPIALLRLSVYVAEVEGSAAYARRSVLHGADGSNTLKNELRRLRKKKVCT